MSMIALYVYDATTFTIDAKIEPMGGPPIAAGEVTLQPGVYRLPGGANISARAVPRGQPSYSVVSVDDTKGGFPDPPLSPIPGYTMSEIQAFFGGAGKENAI